jgi:hypothetical protein
LKTYSIKKKTRSNGSDVISLKEVVLDVQEWSGYILTKWKLIVLSAILGAVAGYAYAYFKKPVYLAECTFVLEEEKMGGGFGQYAGVASMIGIDLSGGGGGIFQGDNIIELYKSRLMLKKTLLSRADFNGKNDLLINRFVKINKLDAKWRNSPGLKNINFNIPPSEYTLSHDSILSSVIKEINKNYLAVEKPDKKLSIIRVQVKAGDELFAKIFTDKIVENVNEFYIQTKTKKSVQNLALLQRQADSIRRVLNASIGGSAAAIDANPNANAALQILRVPSQRRQVDVEANSAIYAEVVKNMEIARMTLRKDTPLIQVIDTPELPLEVNVPGKFFSAIAGAVFLVLLSVIFFSLQQLIKIPG